MGKLKFGVFLPFYAYQSKEPKQHFDFVRKTVLECERLGYHSVWLDDHLMYNDWSILECWATLSALSSLTSRIRLGTMVSCIAHRNPALLAKMSATLDVLSGGRLEFGVGTGIQEAEHLAYGFGFSKPSVRIEQLAEALEITRQLWTQKKANYKGKYYMLKDAVCEPKPLQKPYPCRRWLSRSGEEYETRRSPSKGVHVNLENLLGIKNLFGIVNDRPIHQSIVCAFLQPGCLHMHFA